jgi:hypothetical protein
MNGLLKYHGADFVLLLLGLLGQNKAVAVSKTGSGGGGGGGTVAGSERKRSRNHLTGCDSGGGGHGSGSGSGHKKKRAKSASTTHNHNHSHGQGYGHSLGQSYKSQSLEEYDGNDDDDDDNRNDAGGATKDNFEDAGRHTENGMSAHKFLHRQQQQQRGAQAATPLSILSKKTTAVKLRDLGPSSEERKGDSAEKETIGFGVGTSCWAAVAKRHDETVSTAQTNSSPFRQKEYGIKKCICLTDYGDQVDKRLVSALVSAWMAAIRALDSLSALLQRYTAEGRSLQLVHKLSALVSGILEYFSPTDCDVVLGDVADVFNEYISRCNTSAWHSALGLKDSLFSFLEDGGR